VGRGDGRFRWYARELLHWQVALPTGAAIAAVSSMALIVWSSTSNGRVAANE
jgi:hypothetical protein